jgi:hypothetical protein
MARGPSSRLLGCACGEDGLPDPGFAMGALPGQLPAGTYALETPLANAETALTAFLLGATITRRSKPPNAARLRLVPPVMAPVTGTDPGAWRDLRP